MRILFLVSLLLATVADAQLVIESNGNHLFPDRLATGPTEFDLLDSDDIMARDGTLVYCENCPPGAPPAGPCVVGSQNCGAYCFRVEGVWVCSTEATCTAVGQDCVMDHECCTGVCTSGMCTVPISPTMCTPFICPIGAEQIGADSNCNPICGLEQTTTTTTPSNPCIPNACLNGGTCALGGAGGFVCLCPCNFCGDHCESLCGTTTTTSAATTTTGAGSTTTGPATTTTSTTIPLLPSTTFIVLPNYPTDEVDFQWATGRDAAMVCARVLNGVPIINATKMASYITHSCGSFQSYDVAIYPDDDAGTYIVRAQFQCDTVGMHSVTSLSAFSLPSNTVYRLCICPSNVVNFGINAGYLGAHWITNGGFASTLSSFVPTSVGYAQKLCGTTAPDKTGFITADPTLVPPLVWISAE